MSKRVQQIDSDTLAHYLKNQIGGFQGPLTAQKFSGGQSNPTFLLTTPGKQYVLRRKPPGQLLQSAHAVDREYTVLHSLRDTSVPVATPYCLCLDNEVIGSMFYVMSFEDGRIFWDPALPELHREQRAPLYLEMVRVLAALHDLNPCEVGLEEYGKPGNYFERQLGRWTKQYRAAETQTLDEVEQLIAWLRDNRPPDDDQVSLIHGDYRLDNIIFYPDRAEARAVIDWELSTLGHPLADLAYFCMCLRLPPNGPVKGLEGLDRKVLGVPEEAEVLDHYCRLRSIDGIEKWTFYLAFSFFRLAAIAQGVLKRALDGNASSERALEAGSMAPKLAQLAMDMITERT